MEIRILWFLAGGFASFPAPVEGERDTGDDEGQVHERIMQKEWDSKDNQSYDQQEREKGKERIKRDAEDVRASDTVSPHFEKRQCG